MSIAFLNNLHIKIQLLKNKQVILNKIIEKEGKGQLRRPMAWPVCIAFAVRRPLRRRRAGRCISARVHTERKQRKAPAFCPLLFSKKGVILKTENWIFCKEKESCRHAARLGLCFACSFLFYPQKTAGGGPYVRCHHHWLWRGGCGHGVSAGKIPAAHAGAGGTERRGQRHHQSEQRHYPCGVRPRARHPNGPAERAGQPHGGRNL